MVKVVHKWTNCRYELDAFQGHIDGKVMVPPRGTKNEIALKVITNIRSVKGKEVIPGRVLGSNSLVQIVDVRSLCYKALAGLQLTNESLRTLIEVQYYVSIRKRGQAIA